MKRKPLLMNIRKGLLDNNQKTIIGVVGTHRSAGVTHLCIMLATYISDILGKRTAVLECNQHSDFAYIQQAYEGNLKKAKCKEFIIYNVMYYKCVNEKEIADIMNDNYDYIIIDFGSDLDQYSNEFLRCNSKLIVGSLCDWKRHKFYSFLRKAENMNGYLKWQYLMLFGEKEEIKEVQHDLNIMVNSIPYEPDPFRISKVIMNLFQKIG